MNKKTITLLVLVFLVLTTTIVVVAQDDAITVPLVEIPLDAVPECTGLYDLDWTDISVRTEPHQWGSKWGNWYDSGEFSNFNNVTFNVIGIVEGGEYPGGNTWTRVIASDSTGGENLPFNGQEFYIATIGNNACHGAVLARQESLLPPRVANIHGENESALACVYEMLTSFDWSYRYTRLVTYPEATSGLAMHYIYQQNDGFILIVSGLENDQQVTIEVTRLVDQGRPHGNFSRGRSRLFAEIWLQDEFGNNLFDAPEYAPVNELYSACASAIGIAN